jgi:uncharacterized membrane protein YphA (DoxX/SURF4 family)
MVKQPADDDRIRPSKYIILIVQYFFGTHALVSGLNWFLLFFPNRIPTDPLGHAFVSAMIDTGLFDVIKVVEILVGLALLTGRFVPLALIMELPISITIFGLAMIGPTDRSIISGPREVLLNVFLLVVYAEYYLPLLRSWSAPIRPLWRIPTGRWFAPSPPPRETSTGSQ